MRPRFLALLLMAAPAVAAQPATLPLRASYQPSAEPLTTERVWTLDPGELNPHRQRWVLERKVELKSLEAVELPDAPESARFGLATASLESMTTAYLRADGPWFRAISEFPCSAEPVSWFATPQGARQAADAAAQLWDKLLGAEKLRLSLLLERVRAESAESALRKQQTIFRQWLSELDSAWRARSRGEAKKQEWALYRKLAKEAKVCPRKSAPEAAAWESMMEPPATGDAGLAGPKKEMRLLARAPAKRWDGLFSIRVTLVVGDRRLNGRFLVDSGVGTSVISPDWLIAQGIPPSWVANPLKDPQRVPWGGTGQGGLAPWALVDHIEIGNYPVMMSDFQVFDTEFFAPPDTGSSCCDGVLGTDFLRNFVVELQPGPPAEVKFWPPASFHLAADSGAQWIETGLTADGEAVSACVVQAEAGAGAKRKGSPQSFVGVRWDTGREAPLDIHVPWQGKARAAVKASRDNSWAIRCGRESDRLIASGAPATFPAMDPYESVAILSKVPAASVGMGLLGRGNVFLDFPHGRVWFTPRVSDEPFRVNRTGLRVAYRFVKNKQGGETTDRELRVSALQSGKAYPARSLWQRGLRPGSVITRVDSLDADQLDSWEVERRLAGAYGDKVLLQWKTPSGLRLGEVKVR